MDLGENIQELRKRKGMSQEQLAEYLGVTRQSISKWELGASVPDIDKLKAISQLFAVSMDELLDNEVKDEPAGESCNTSQVIKEDRYLGRIERLIKKKGYKFGYVLIGWGAVALPIIIGFAFIFWGTLNAMKSMKGNFGDIVDNFDGMPGFEHGMKPLVKNFDLFDGALRVFALAPYLLMIIPAAVIILGIIIVVKGKKYGESIE